MRDAPFISLHVPPALRTFGHEVLRALYAAQDLGAEEYAEQYRLQIIRDDALASHEFVESVAVRTVYDEGGLPWKRVREAYSGVIQARVIEEGRKPGLPPPPVSAILEWMPRKGMEADPSHAYAIARSIGKKGIRPRHTAAKAYATASPMVEKFFESAVEAAVTLINTGH